MVNRAEVQTELGTSLLPRSGRCQLRDFGATDSMGGEARLNRVVIQLRTDPQRAPPGRIEQPRARAASFEPEIVPSASGASMASTRLPPYMSVESTAKVFRSTARSRGGDNPLPMLEACGRRMLWR
jgi:hypothetical protein